MNSQTLNSFDLFFMISFLSALKFVCYTNGVHKKASLLLFPVFMKHPTAAAPNIHFVLLSILDRSLEKGTATSYSEAVHYVLLPYTTDQVIVESDAGMGCSSQPSKPSSLDYAETM